MVSPQSGKPLNLRLIIQSGSAKDLNRCYQFEIIVHFPNSEIVISHIRTKNTFFLQDVDQDNDREPKLNIWKAA